VDALYGALVDMADHGFIRKEEFRRMAIPVVARTRAEFTEPFGKSGHFADLSIENFELFDGEDRIWAQFKASGDARAFGAQWAAFCRASVFPTLATSLDEVRDDTGSAKFMDQLEAGIAARLSTTPVRMTIPLAQMTLVKALPEK
jgi:hypothetical protein